MPLRTLSTLAIVRTMPTERDAVSELLPLPPATFHILLALSAEERQETFHAMIELTLEAVTQ